MITVDPADVRNTDLERDPSNPETDWPLSVMHWVPLLVPVGAALLIGFIFAVATAA